MITTQAVYCTFAAIAFVLVLLPVPWHWRSRNTGTLLHIFWTVVPLVFKFVDAIIWRDNVRNPAPVWCDIASVPGLTIASLCIDRRLASIATSKNTGLSNESRRRQMVTDLIMGLGIPSLLMVFSYIVQPHRMTIWEGYGCLNPLWGSLPAVFLLLIWPIVFASISAIYGIIAIRAFLKQRLYFKAVLRGSKTGLTTGRFIRLVALATSDIFITIPFTVYSLAFRVQHLFPWVSWSVVHSYWEKTYTETMDELITEPENIIPTFISRWIPILAGLLFFAFFGLADDAVAESTDIPNLPSLGTRAVGPIPDLVDERKEFDLDEAEKGATRLKQSGLASQTAGGIVVTVKKDTSEV